MPYDPTLPLNNAQVQAQVLRGQFTGLKDLIDAAPTITGVAVDGVTTGNPGDPAAVVLTLTGTTLHFSFTLPRGDTGPTGGNGSDGSSVTDAIIDGTNTLNPGDAAQANVSWDGANVRFTFGIPRGSDGTNGIQGPPFAGVVVDAVLNLPPGDLPTVVTSFDGTNVHFTFGLPRGFDGNTGATGQQGLPGEVSNAQLSNAIGGTSNVSNAVGTLDTPFANDPPTLADLELLRAKMNELITALRR